MKKGRKGKQKNRYEKTGRKGKQKNRNCKKQI